MKIIFENQSISGLAVSGDLPGETTILLATNGSLFLSRDGGDSWIDTFGALGLQDAFAVTSVLSLPRAGRAPLLLAGVSGGVLRSEDGGSTWQFSSPVSPAPVVSVLAAWPDGGLFAGTAQDGIFSSQDGGQKWVRWNFGLLDCHIFSLLCQRGVDGSQMVYAGTETGIFTSANQGRTWRERDFPLDAGAVLSLACQPGPQNGTLYAGTEAGGLLRSSELENSWVPIGAQNLAGEIVCLTTLDDRLLAAAEDKLWVSPDRGETWRICFELAEEDGVITALALNGPQPGGMIWVGSSAGSLYGLPAGSI